jgi:peptidyl-prolyl cis-trans isomerase C
MNRLLVAALCALFASSAVAQQPVADAEKIVATINGEVITKARLDALYSGMNAQMRAQYDRAGGKKAFLDTYIAKRLLIQEAMKSGFDEKPEVKFAVEAARESTIFDRYVRETVAMPLVSDAEARKYYDEHKNEFAIAEQVKVRHIIAMTQKTSREAALEKLQKVMLEIRQGMPSGADDNAQILLSRFAEAARRYSEDGSAQAGGDLGWQSRGSLDSKFEEAAFNIRPGTMSGIVESAYGLHLIYVEDKKPASTQRFEDVRNDIREFLIAQKGAEVMASLKRLTSELRLHSKVGVFPENLD